MTGVREWPSSDVLAHRAETTPDATAVVDADHDCSWTFAGFDRRVDVVAASLASHVEAGDRLGLLLDTGIAFAEVYFAATRLGVELVPLHVRETAPELASKAERTDLDALVCEEATEATALEIVDGPVLSVADPDRAEVHELEVPALERPVEPAAGEVPANPADPDATHLVLFTSGTSGEPKAVRLTVGNLLASATASAFRLGVDHADRWLCCLPMYHMGGLAPLVRSTLYGTTVVIQRTFDPDATARVFEAYDVTGVSLVPTMCKRLLESGWQPPESLRFVLLGGAPASAELLERCHAADVPVYPTYGMTETASQIATATPAEALEYGGTVGQPLVVTDVTVVDDDGGPVETGEIGEFVVSGPTVSPGYLDPDHTDAAFTEHGLRTGDVGRRDDDGRLWVLNRRSDRILTGGENVDPGEVVDVLRSHPDVEDAAVVGLPDEEWGERVGSLLVPMRGRSRGDRAGVVGDLSMDAHLDFGSVLEHCDDRLAGFKRPKTIAVIDALPRTASGTVDRQAVRDRLLEDGVDVTARR
ncbi:class I adenylate-forming enzyme family protein [Natrarchaeobaculum aegyptiacum]|uniref:2-succinylbenzoate-CoA ligase n=1 Tax=Natrarchaeobaculum aegyptiacum TaxID=745377 RepID=A0A2Z2HWB4_9EURY|nr:class I adenylate-forming enzyme family protein [Natrarchaeobaculum aegyptiacum]ARS91530.1 2-succinylbenzoate-CoA ligase [Natrarchaeobaculum aegyptiacum]